ncbi:MAG: acyl-CoA thioesterase [Anaerolineae bacterium]|nr:acyl-CoA thioesterase [Anaerolineales bacterium]MCQ3974774.1 acyl-CoA thioesterase [Anaerolineae bacterium]
MNNYQFKLTFEVRDYECDFQGIVNNAVYQNYLEHTRHVFLKERGLDFVELSRQGIDLVVIRVEIDYLYPLRPADRFYVGLNFERVSRLRFGFRQDIFRLPDEKPILQANVIGTALNKAGRPFLPKELEGLFQNLLL